MMNRAGDQAGTKEANDSQQISQRCSIYYPGLLEPCKFRLLLTVQAQALCVSCRV